MELYLLDYNFRPNMVIEEYESLIWTDRYNGHGDFQLTIKDHYMLTNNLTSMQCLGFSESEHIMMIETIDVQSQEDGYDKVTLSGRSLEAFIENRNNMGSGNPEPITRTGTHAQIALWFIERYCVNPTTAMPENVIPNLKIVDASAASGVRPTVTLTINRGNMYDIVKEVLDGGGLGFKIYLDPTDSKLGFMVYDSLDRSNPTTQYYMEYSSDNDNLIQARSLDSVSNWVNNLRAVGNKAQVDVFASGWELIATGWSRRTKVVKYDVGSADTTTAQDIAKLRALGALELAKQQNRHIRMIEGDIPQDSWDKVFFGVGDVVMVKDKYGKRTKSQIVERIWSVDANGPKLTPTFEAV